MTSPTASSIPEISKWWTAAGIVTAVLAIASVSGAVLVQREATKPIGEADVFVTDAESARIIIGEHDADEAVRAARNHLEIEAVSLVTPDGEISVSTSPNLVGSFVTNPLLLDAIASGRFAGLAAPAEMDLMIDGVGEWEAGQVLYEVVAPREDGAGALLLHYDIAGLLGRRVRPGDIQPVTLELGGLGLIFLVLGALAFYGRTRAAQRYEAVKLESDLLRSHASEVQRKNLELDEARRRAERALSLAEEKIRIRSEFVLMINHELRTPLTSVVTGAELLRSSDIDDTEKSAILEMMATDGSRLLGIIDQILSVARIENTGLSKDLAIVPIDELCESLDAEYIGSTATAPVVARTDVDALQMVVRSLADNSRTHGASEVKVLCSHRPMIEPDLLVGARPTSAVFISVMDDGPGIDMEFLPRIFEKFEKSSFSSGTGLGLYMTKMIMEALEGSIAVQTSVEGTTMELAIPTTPVPNLVEVRA